MSEKRKNAVLIDIGLYLTCQEAAAAARRLGITTADEYEKKHSEDPVLEKNNQ